MPPTLRKPHPGIELNNMACAHTGIILHQEIQEGKDDMKSKEFCDRFKATVAMSLRLSAPWFGTGRVVMLDSWFASIPTCLELAKRGLYFIGPIKTSHKGIPITEIRKIFGSKSKKNICPRGFRGVSLTFRTVVPDRPPGAPPFYARAHLSRALAPTINR